MEHRINKVDVEIIQKVLDFTKEEVVHEIKKLQESKGDYTRGENGQEETVGCDSGVITVDAYKVKEEISITATKDKGFSNGKYIDKKR